MPPIYMESVSRAVDTKPLICLRDLSNYRERNVPDNQSVEIKSGSLSNSPMSPATMHRPHSTGSNHSGPLTGQHSPQSSMSGRTPSPPTHPAGTPPAQQLPPACGARQLSKLKRFLTTLIQFGTDISPEIGERVRSLVLALVNNHLSIEEFHSKLQEATNFPLRPFVIPFLKTNLPLLQRELLHCARMARQTPQQYLAHNEHVIFDPTRPPPLDSSCGSDISATDVNENGKRLRSPERCKENGLDGHFEGLSNPAKRAHTISPTRVSPASVRASPASAPRVSPGSVPSTPTTPVVPLRIDDMMNQRERTERQQGETRGDRSLGFPRGDQYDIHMERAEDEWKHLENMLACVMDMVSRCRQALTALQERTRREREDLSRWVRLQNGVDPEVKKRADFMSESLRHAEDRASEVRRRAVHVFPEEAVAEVKRQAMLELQKAVAASEAKTNELLAAERAKMQLQLTEATQRAREEAMRALNQQQDNSECCWNCGRKASETCSGCNTARYCGAFCQHKDWESHHRVCGQALANQRTGSSQANQCADGTTNQPSTLKKDSEIASHRTKTVNDELIKHKIVKTDTDIHPDTMKDNPSAITHLSDRCFETQAKQEDSEKSLAASEVNNSVVCGSVSQDLNPTSSPPQSRSRSRSPIDKESVVSENQA